MASISELSSLPNISTIHCSLTSFQQRGSARLLRLAKKQREYRRGSLAYTERAKLLAGGKNPTVTKMVVACNKAIPTQRENISALRSLPNTKRATPENAEKFGGKRTPSDGVESSAQRNGSLNQTHRDANATIPRESDVSSSGYPVDSENLIQPDIFHITPQVIQFWWYLQYYVLHCNYFYQHSPTGIDQGTAKLQ